MGKYFIGIDGGGSKTEFIMSDDQGNIVARHIKEKSHYLMIGFDGLEKVIHEGVFTCLKEVGCLEKDVEFCAVCICGYEDVKEHDILINKAVDKALPNIPHKVYSDTVNAHRGSLVGKEGVHIIAGTGSIAFGINSEGKSVRCGGWNHLFGGDEGSAYWIACKMLLTFTRQSDGRDKKTYLYEYLKNKYNLEDDGKIIDLTVVDYGFERTKIASMSKDVYTLAKEGDSAAIKIFEEAASELADMIITIGNELKLSKPTLVSYSGGVFNSKEFILKPLQERVEKEGFTLVEPRFSPGIGSVIVAFTESNVEMKEEILDNLSKQD